jgi:hypothetical protein
MSVILSSLYLFVCGLIFIEYNNFSGISNNIAEFDSFFLFFGFGPCY